MEPKRSEANAPAPETETDDALQRGAVLEVNAEQSPAPEWRLRPGEPGDMNFVAESWRRTYDRKGWPSCPGGVPEYIATQSAVIATCLSNSEVTVAYPSGTPEQILGWVCYRRPGVVHYVFVKPYYRNHNIGQALLLAALGVSSDYDIWHTHTWRHMGPVVEHLAVKARAAGRLVQYNPALIFGGKT